MKMYSLAQTSVHIDLIPLLAQVSPDQAVTQFIGFLAQIFLLIGALTIGYGGYQHAQGRVLEGWLGVIGGLILALAIPLMKWLLSIAGVNP